MGREDRESEARPKGSLKQSLSTPANSQVLLAKAEIITQGREGAWREPPGRERALNILHITKHLQNIFSTHPPHQPNTVVTNSSHSKSNPGEKRSQTDVWVWGFLAAFSGSGSVVFILFDWLCLDFN